MTADDVARKGGKLVEGMAGAFNVYSKPEGEQLLAALSFLLDCGADPELRTAFEGAAATAVARAAARPRPAPQPAPAPLALAASPQQLLAQKVREAVAANPALGTMLAAHQAKAAAAAPAPQPRLSFVERARRVKEETEMQFAALKQVFGGAK